MIKQGGKKKKSKSWGPFLNFQNAIYDAVINDNKKWKELVNLEQYINYFAVIGITGTDHLNNHNIPMVRPKNALGFIPIGYDFGGSYARLVFRDVLIPEANMECLNHL